jgi:hypothetical protein
MTTKLLTPLRLSSAKSRYRVTRLDPSMNEGGCGACSLNRHEGFPVAALERLTPKELSRMENMPEAKLRRLVPELEDSWVILDLRLVDMVEVLSRDQAKLMLRNCDPDQTPRPAPDAAMSSSAQSPAR